MKKIVMFVLCIGLILSNSSTQNAGDNQSKEKFNTSTTNRNALSEFNEGRTFFLFNNYKPAEKYLKSAIKIDPKFIDAYDILGVVYQRQQKYDKAEEMYTKSLSLYSDNTYTLINYGNLLAITNREEDALTQYKKVTTLDSEDPESYYGIGSVYVNQQKYSDAVDYLKKAATIYENTNSNLKYDSYYLLATSFYNIQNKPEALKYYKLVKEFYKNDPKIDDKIKELE